MSQEGALAVSPPETNIFSISWFFRGGERGITQKYGLASLFRIDIPHEILNLPPHATVLPVIHQSFLILKILLTHCFLRICIFAMKVQPWGKGQKSYFSNDGNYPSKLVAYSHLLRFTEVYFFVYWLVGRTEDASIKDNKLSKYSALTWLHCCRFRNTKKGIFSGTSLSMSPCILSIPNRSKNSIFLQNISQIRNHDSGIKMYMCHRTWPFCT